MLENPRRDDLRVGVGVGVESEIRWERVPVGARVSLRHNAPLQLGQENGARRLYVEMRKTH